MNVAVADRRESDDDEPEGIEETVMSGATSLKMLNAADAATEDERENTMNGHYADRSSDVTKLLGEKRYYLCSVSHNANAAAVSHRSLPKLQH